MMTIANAGQLNRLYRKYVGEGRIDVPLLVAVVRHETSAAEQGRIHVTRGLLRELRADRAEIGRLANREPVA